MNEQYIPKPLDTSSIKFPIDLLKLVEILAKNNHDIWAQQRFAEGWRYGERRNDEQKEHPCLVPYEDLSEQEKEYDRNTSIGVLKAIMKLGFKIEKR